MTNKKHLTIFEAFAGYGSQYLALKKEAEDYKIKVDSLGMIEWYIPAIKAYTHLHDLNYFLDYSYTEEEVKAINQLIFSNDSKKPNKTNYLLTLNEDKKDLIVPYLLPFVRQPNNYISDIKNHNQPLPKDIDILTYSFPCQDISNMGSKKGFADNSNTHSSMLWHIGRLLELSDLDLRPKILLMENVAALASNKFDEDLNKWLLRLIDLGYRTKCEILDAGDFGSSQRRKRLFCVSWLENKFNNYFSFWDINKWKNKYDNLIINHIINHEHNTPENNLFGKLIKPENLPEFKKNGDVISCKLQGLPLFNIEASVFDPKGKGRTNIARSNVIKVKLQDNYIRSLKYDEVLRYMDLDQSEVDKILKANLAPTHFYRIASNSICIKPLRAIFGLIIEFFNNNLKEDKTNKKGE
ncbi:Modification methylase BanI [Mesomycoplasma conjunctivae]|nr:Modification methylase BanI [Mesomycoplasma conjunctivae]